MPLSGGGVPYRVSVFSVDLALLHDTEADAVRLAAEAHNLLLGAGLLAAKLVAGETEYNQPLADVLLVKGLQPGVLLGVHSSSTARV